jgi:HK97 family phage portal protein
MDLSIVKRVIAAPARSARKMSEAGRVALMNVPMPGPVEHYPFDRLAKETYERNVTVYACVTGISRNGSGVPWLLYERSRARGGKSRRVMTAQTYGKSMAYAGRNAWHVRKALELTEVEDSALLGLLERPNPWMAKAAYLQTLIAQWLLSGNAYEEFIAPKTKSAEPVEMYPLRPDRMRVIPAAPGSGEWVAGYNYKAGSHEMNFAPESIIHRKFFHPTNDFYGMSPLQAAARAWQTDNSSADWNYALLKNQARPSGALVAPTVLADDSFERVKQEIMASFDGTDPGRPLFLEGGLDWKQFSFSPVDLDWASSKSMTRVEICSVFNWPPELVGDAAHKTYNSFPEARRAGWMEAILPILDAIRDEYNSRLAPRFGDRLFLDYDRDQIDALQEDAQRVWLRVGGAKHISYNEMREATGYEPYDDPEADIPVGLLGNLFSGSAPLGAPGEVQVPVPGGVDLLDAGEMEEQKPKEPKPAEPDGGDPVAEAAKAFGALRFKNQRLSAEQRRNLVKLRAAMKRLFKGQGREVARHVAREVEKEL